MSTELFSHYVDEHNCKLYSIDNINYKDKFNNSKWNFIHSRDDEFDYIENIIPKKFSLILLDTIHEAKHVCKIFYYYYEKLEINKCFFIDDISWLPYVKDSDKDRFYAEINNQETFNTLLNIYFNNNDNINIEFTFEGTGMCKIIKLNDNKLNPINKKIHSRKFTFKNLIRKIIKG